MKSYPITIPRETIISRIFFVRGKKVMFDRDLAELYDVETKVLNQAVKRNLERFPPDFMFRLNNQETKTWQGYFLKSQIVALNQDSKENALGVLRSQIVTSKDSRGGQRYSSYVFTEQGVAMLSSVLKTSQAVQVNIQIIRTFTKLREILSDNKKLAEKLEKLEQKYDKKIADIFNVIKHLVAEDEKPKEKIGFNVRK
jgi:phage regulator Rha-like protein